jgi:hypothetical protein
MDVSREEFGVSVSGRGERSRGFAFQLSYVIAPTAGLMEVAQMAASASLNPG